MPELKSPKHEYFAIGITNDVNPTEAYISAGYSKAGAAAGAWRLLNLKKIRDRINELRAERHAAITKRVIEGEILTTTECLIAERNQQVRLKWQRYQKLSQIVQERTSFFTDPKNEAIIALGGPDKLPGVDTGFVTLRYRTLGRKVVPELNLDVPLLREMSLLEEQVGRMMGFIQPISISQTNNSQTVAVQAVQANVYMRDKPPELVGRSVDQLRKLMDLAKACQASGVHVELPQLSAPPPAADAR